MVRILLNVSVVAALLASEARGDDKAPPLISVSGTAEVRVVPDEITMTASVEVAKSDLDSAKTASDQKIKEVISFLNNSGIDAKDVQTGFVSIHPRYDDRRTMTGYEVERGVEIRLRNVSQFEAVLSGLLKSGVNRVDRIDLRTTELRKHRDEARKLAVRAAKEKADDLAKELAVRAGKPYSIQESWDGGFSGPNRLLTQNAFQSAPVPAFEESGGMSLGQISISATVNVSFVIE